MRQEFDPWAGKILQKRKCQPTPLFLPGESRGQKCLEGSSPWGTKSQTQLKPFSRQNYLNISMTSTSCWNPDYLSLELIAISWLDYHSVSSPVSGRANVTWSSEYTISLLNISHDLLSST